MTGLFFVVLFIYARHRSSSSSANSYINLFIQKIKALTTIIKKHMLFFFFITVDVKCKIWWNFINNNLILFLIVIFRLLFAWQIKINFIDTVQKVIFIMLCDTYTVCIYIRSNEYLHKNPILIILPIFFLIFIFIFFEDVEYYSTILSDIRYEICRIWTDKLSARSKN